MPLLDAMRGLPALLNSDTVKEDDLETILLRMARFGPPNLSQFTDGEWSCSVDVRVTAVGASFKIRSEFSCKTPLAAAKQCEQRIKEAISKFGK